MFDGAVNGGVQVNLNGDQGRSDGVEEEAHLIVAGDDDRRRPLVGSLGLHPRRQGLPPDGDVVAHARKHLVRNRHLQDRLQPIFPVEIRTQFPHLPSCIIISQTQIIIRLRKNQKKDPPTRRVFKVWGSEYLRWSGHPTKMDDTRWAWLLFKNDT